MIQTLIANQRKSKNKQGVEEEVKDKVIKEGDESDKSEDVYGQEENEEAALEKPVTEQDNSPKKEEETKEVVKSK